MNKRRVVMILPIVAGLAAAHGALAAIPDLGSQTSGPAWTVSDSADASATVQITDAADPVAAADTDEIRNDDAPGDDAAAVDPRHVTCVAKVIVHEAGNQPHDGQVAVAQVIRARVADGRFAADPCAVVRQPGQFFDVDAYQPARTGSRWKAAVAIAEKVLSGGIRPVAPGALFFHSAGASMPGRTRIAQIGGHSFYR